VSLHVLSISSARADVGILAPVWRALAATDGIELEVMLTGMHATDDATARAALPAGVEARTGGADMAGASPAEASKALAACAGFAGELYAETTPDAVLAVGDRLDMLAPASAALPFNLPILHLHGGELTYGAVDDRVRHALTKLAHVHCVSSPEAARRVSRMGEEPWRIHVTGAPGLDELLAQPEIDAAALAEEVGLPSVDGLRLVTVHAETNAETPDAAAAAVLEALEAAPAPTLITAPNADPGGAAIRRRIEAFVAEHVWAVFRDTLGARLYANAMRHAAVMVGNSSSALIEAPLFGLVAANVGGRQDGRARGANVVDCRSRAADVRDALSRAASLRPAPGASPYGDGRAAPRIAAVLTALEPRDRLLYKRFADPSADFAAPWDSASQLQRKAG